MKITLKNREKSFRQYSVCILLILFVSCYKKVPIPSYIHIDKFNFSVSDPITQGSASNKIVDAWIEVDDQSVGAFELPCTIPVIYSGEHKITARPGIKDNGSATLRVVYQFYTAYVQTVTLTPKQITTISPSVTYASYAHFAWLENFDGNPNITSIMSSNSDTVMKTIVPPLAFEGAGSGAVYLAGSKTYYYGASLNKYVLPKFNAPVYLEMDFNCNSIFSVGIIGYDANNIISLQQELLKPYPTSGWNKVYINLTSAISGSANSEKFAIYFSMQKDITQTTSYFYIDNIKIVN